MLKADVANNDGALWPGQYVTAIVDLSVHKNATTVPLIAVQQGNDGSFVFLVHADKTVAMQPVTLASTVGDIAVIASGIKPGDQVVVDGQLHLQDGATVQTSLAQASDTSPSADKGGAASIEAVKMNISSIFIRRPIATILLSIALAASGLFAYRFLPVAALPEVDFPIITVSAKLPGAAPDTMANAVATPLIKQFSTIQAISTISATSTLGSTQITLEFDLNRNIDQAAADVEAAIASTLRRLPANMTTPPSYRKTNPADAPVVLVALQSDTMQLSKLDDYAENVMSPAFSTITGVGEVQVLGAKQYAVRVEVDPNAATARGIGLDELTNAVAANNSIAPVGTISSPTQQMAIEADTQAQNADTFRQIIIASPNGKLVRLGDVARVVDSVATTQTESRYDGKQSLVLAVFRQPGANTVDVVDRVKAILPQFTQDLGPSASIHILNDRSASIRQAVSDVQFTLILTIALVIMVIFVFLRRLSATMIPIIAVPLSLIATLGAMYVLGFSIDNISLLGLTLSVGLVVDDAIVMLENITRHIEDGHVAARGGIKGQRGDRLHDHLDHYIARCRVHSHSAHGRRCRAYLQ